MKHGEAKSIPRFVRRTSTTLPTLARTWSFPQLRSPKRSPPWPWPRWPWACPATGWRGARRTWPSYGQRWKLCGCRRPHHRDMGTFQLGGVWSCGCIILYPCSIIFPFQCGTKELLIEFPNHVKENVQRIHQQKQ